jgi:tRNA-specific 2-thiouridylase
VQPGDIVDESGRVLGQHRGIIHFTIGQRKKLGLSGELRPLYVLALDAARARVVVGPDDALRVRSITLRDVNWLARVEGAVDCTVKVRSTREAVAARVSPGDDGRAVVELPAGESAVAPGQACVFYDGTRVLGGGWIAKADTLPRAA